MNVTTSLIVKFTSITVRAWRKGSVCADVQSLVRDHPLETIFFVSKFTICSSSQPLSRHTGNGGRIPLLQRDMSLLMSAPDVLVTTHIAPVIVEILSLLLFLFFLKFNTLYFSTNIPRMYALLAPLYSQVSSFLFHVYIVAENELRMN